jgi:hypothetical protein
VALGLLSEARACWTEDFGGFSVTRFDRATVTV